MSSPSAEERDRALPRHDAELRLVATAVRQAVQAAGAVPRDRLRAGLGALLDALAEDVERTWAWLALWPVADPDLAGRRRAADELLSRALVTTGLSPEAAARAVRDGWALVHEHLWEERHADLRGLLGPIMALVALRASGPAAVRDALAAHGA